LNIQTLIRNLLKPGEALVHTKYFTARVSYPPDKVKRQSTFIEALQTLREFSIFYGKYQLNLHQCRICGSEYRIPNEKMTDVNISVELMQDAFQNIFDTALLVSADSDLVSPVSTVRRLFPSKRVVVAFPPARTSASLQKVASAWFPIGRAVIAKSLFPDEVHTAAGIVLTKPASWK
jgi:uncharacterized LabA/DUF88 family protein